MAYIDFKNDNQLLQKDPGLATVEMLRSGFTPRENETQPFQTRYLSITRRIEDLNDMMKRAPITHTLSSCTPAHLLTKRMDPPTTKSISRRLLKLERQKALNASLLAPVRRMPVEMLELIFRELLGEYDPYQWAYTLCTSIIPVCFFWCQTARGATALWTFINISWPSTQTTQHMEPLHLTPTKAQISLSGSLPLGIKYHCNSRTALAPILQLCAARLESLTYTGTQGQINDEPSFHLPSLTSAVIVIEWQIVRVTLAMIAHAPRVKHLSVVQNCNYHAGHAYNPWFQDARVVFPPFPQLTSLSIDLLASISQSDLLAALEPCKNTLSTLLIHAMVSTSGSGINSSLTLTALQTADLSGNAIDIGSLINAPNLVSLSLRRIPEAFSPPCIFGSIRQLAGGMLTRTLRCLTLDDVSTWSSCVGSRCCALPMAGIQRLHITDLPEATALPKLYVPFMQAMTYTSGKQPLLPSLTHLTLRYWGRHVEDGLQDAIDDFMCSRQAAMIGELAQLEVFKTNLG
ncbi:hypothetical protein GGG16DRAFT_119595 [Schizophyllum commune]